MVQVGDGGGSDAYARPELGNGAHQGGALGAEGETVADILHIDAGDHLAVAEEQGCADAEARIGRIRIQRGLTGRFQKLRKRGKRRGGRFRVIRQADLQVVGQHRHRG